MRWLRRWMARREEMRRRLADIEDAERHLLLHCDRDANWTIGMMRLIWWMHEHLDKDMDKRWGIWERPAA
jgi:hypothetical protein